MLIAACGGAWGDGAWGPRVDLSCRPFDFTLFFQDVIFSCIPNAVFLLLAPAGIWHRWRQPVVQGQALWLYRCKLAVLTALLVSQAVFLALRVSTNHGTMNTNASLAGDVLGLLAIAAAIPLSYLHHFRSIRPSTVLALYFSALSLLNIARLRTLWQLTAARSNGISAVFTIIFILMLAALGFESKSQNGPSHAAKSNTPEPFSGFWKRLSYAWLARTFRRGYSAVLSVESLPELDPQIESRKLHLQLEHVWSNCKKGRRHALLYSCLRAYLAPFLSAVIPRVCLTCFTFSQPFLIETTIEYIGQPSAEADYGKALIGAYALVFVGIAASTAFYWYQTFRLVVSIRGSLISLIHQRSLGTRAIDLGESTAITLMGTDTERIVTGFRSIHELWGSFLDIVVAMYLLERQLGVACLVPLAIILVFAGVTGRLSGKSNNAQRSWIEKIQARLRLASSMLGDMKAVKTLGLSDKMFSILQAMRLVEIRTSEKFRKLLIWQLLLSNAPALLAPVATFALYAGISLVRHDSSLLAAKAFTSLTLISLLTTPVLELLQSIPAVIQCIGCFDRIQDYCSKPSSAEELKVDNDVSSPNSLSSDLAFELVDNVDVTVISISIQGKSFGWSHDDPPVLKDIDLVINFGKIVMAIGPVGSGKTTLLESILGETLSMPEGSTNASNSLSDRLEIAYCSQSPWLRDTTIQQNIIGCDEMDPKWYATVLWACELNADLEQLPRGDLTIVGSNGAGLSGGQKQRITLARAFYCRRRIILLDDIFSGIDANTTSLIVRRLFGTAGLARQSRTTVLLATHNLKLLPYADEIVVLEDGRLTAGDISNVQKYATTEEKYEDGPHHASTRVGMLAESEDPERAIDVSVIADPSLNSIGDPLTNSTDEVIQSSKRQSGDWQIYKYYANASGYHYVLVFLIGQALGSFFRDFPTIWLLWWSNANAQNPGPRTDGLYLSVYAVLTLAGLASLLLGCWALIIKMVSNSAANLHSNLLKSVLGAPIYFFQTVDTGSLTNRFSQDMELIDMSLPMYAINYVFNTFNLVVKAIILLIFARYLGVALPFVVAIVSITQNFYLRTSRQIRLLDIEAKAPLYNHFIEVVAGSSTIRAMGSAWKDSFQQEVYARIDFSQRPFYLLLCIQQCLALVLDLTVAILAILVVAIIVTWRDAFQEGDVGVALSMLITFSSTLMSVVKFWTLMEMSVGAVARVRDFVAETDSEEPEDRVAHGQEASRRSLTPPADWPQAGAIDLEGVIAAYSPLAPPVLKGISLSIKPGEKIAICGRSGSGKTSLMLSLLQITDVRGGSIKIDGIDILSSDIRRTELRSRLNVINQDPFLMPGTVRFNMDPFGLSNDETIVAALKKVRLWDLIADDGGVEREMNSEALSAGQRQLFCLARAMVRQGKILVLDEATSNVDNETESIMYNAIASEFVGVTVLSVVHRLPHIGFYDRVCILEKGEVADIGTSEELAERSSIFSDLLKFGGDAAIPESTD